LLNTLPGRKSRINESGRDPAEFTMTGKDNQFESHPSLVEHQQMQDHGGARSGRERRKESEPFDGSEQRSGRDRRRGFDRRSGIERRRSNGRRNERYFRDGELVERRDVFRKQMKED
jgi:hypothetical protein